jgi:diguanylate cyclase (GGDEF)-like protein
MECKFLDAYRADLDGDTIEVWHCRKRDPFVLGATKEIALDTCAACRLSDYSRAPAELAIEVERRNQELVALNAIVTAVNSSLDLDTLLNLGLDKVLEILQVNAGWLALADGQVLRLAAHRGLSSWYAERIFELTVGQGIVGMVVKEQETIVVDDVQLSPAPLPFTRREGIISMLAAPLKAQGRLLGVLVAASHAPRSYSADDIYFATAAGAQLALAIDHALLFREQAESAARERRLLEAAERVNRSLGSQDTVRTAVLAEAARLLNAQKSALLVCRGDELVAEAVYNLSEKYRRLFVIPVGDSVSGRAITISETVAVDDVDEEPLVDSVLVGEGGYRAFMTAPLESHMGTYGAISVYFDEQRHFSDDEKTLLRTFAIHCGIALENRRLMNEQEQMAMRDGLTGVYNRSYLEWALERSSKELERNGGTVSILFVDVDNLKRINDRHGHREGDDLLCALARLLSESCRGVDIVARYGGDEFVVLMPDTDRAGAAHVAEKVTEAIARCNRAGKNDVLWSASMGMHTAAADTVDTLLHEADRRMYEMKRERGRADD